MGSREPDLPSARRRQTCLEPTRLLHPWLLPTAQGRARSLRQNPALVFGADAVAANLQSSAPAAASATFDPAAAAVAARGSEAQRGAELDAKQALMVFERHKSEAGSGGILGKVAELEAALEKIIRESWKKETDDGAKSEAGAAGGLGQCAWVAA